MDFIVNHIYLSLLILAILINFIIVVAMIFIERKETSVTLAWILTFVLFPLVGFLFYQLIGSTRKFRSIHKKRQQFREEHIYRALSRRQASAIFKGRFAFLDAHAEKYRNMILFHANNARCYYTQDNQVELLPGAKSKFERMMEDIKSAKESINVLYFIIKSKDNIAKEMIALLAKKARQGVCVRLVYDYLGDTGARIGDYDALIQAGGVVYRYMPSLFLSLLYSNYRTHRKMVIIDGQIAYTGGINVGDEYFGTHPKKTPWRDTSIRLTGHSVVALQVLFLQDLFALDRYYRKKRKGHTPLLGDQEITALLKAPEQTGKMGVQIVASGPDTAVPCVKDGYIKMINEAKKYCYIQSPYFIPDESIMDALRLAALSGVDVRVMLPGVADKPYVYYITLSNVEQLLEAGVHVYFHAGFLHAKMVVIDDAVATVGTTNMDIRSFVLDYEVNAFVYHEDFAKECRDLFIQDVNDSKKVSLKEYKKRGLWRRICESVCRLISPLA